jgi:hypothetical protein
MKEAAEKIKGLIDTQKRKGTYDYNEHMFGVLIGLELAYYSLLGEEAQYTEKPEKWLKDSIPKKFVPEVANIQRVNMYGEVCPQYPFNTSS